MHRKGFFSATAAAVVLSACISLNAIPVSAASVKYYQFGNTGSLKEGMAGVEIIKLQARLKRLGIFKQEPTGYFGSITKDAVESLQEKHGIKQDGIVGKETDLLIKGLLESNISIAARTMSADSVKTSRSTRNIEEYRAPSWFGYVDEFFERGDTAKIYDIETGLSFNMKRTYGYNHADCETLTVKDTAIMKKIYGGEWSWERRAVIVTVNGRDLPASMAGMPHAGVDSKKANIIVSGRSEGYGTGENLDLVKDNGMDGHFDVHFWGSKTHGTDRVDEGHQSMILKAVKWANANL